MPKPTTTKSTRNNFQWMKKNKTAIIGIFISVFIILFGNNIIERMIGHSIFNWPQVTSTIIPPSHHPEVTSTIILPRILFLRASCSTTYTIEAGRPLELHYGSYGMRGIELLQENMSHVTIKLFIDGILVNGTQSPIIPMLKIPCGNILPDSFWVVYIAQLDSLPLGEHQIEVIYTFDKQITDGYDQDNDGNLDFYYPDNPIHITFNVIAQ